MPRASHSAAQLVQLRQTEALGILDDDDRGAWHVHAHLQHGRGDQDIELAGTKGRHHLLLFGAGHLSVQQTHPRRRQERSQLAETRQHRGTPALLGNRRTNDEALSAGCDGRFDRSQGFAARGLAHTQMCRHDLSAGWRLVEGDQIEIAVSGQGQRAWDRGGGQHQQVGNHAGFLVGNPAPSSAQGGPLAHPEPMLLVHDGQGKPRNAQSLFQQRMRAHQ